MISGIVYFDKRVSVSSHMKDEFRKSLLRRKDMKYLETDFGNAYFIRCNTGAISQNDGLTETPNGVSIIAGEPLFSGINEGSYLLIHDAFRTGNTQHIEEARGVYCAVSYWVDEQLGPSVVLCADKLGIRPLYYYVCREYLVFATSLRIFECLPFIPKTPNEDALCQMMGLGFALGENTQYKNICLLKPAQIVYFKENSVKKTNYYEWANIGKLSGISRESILREAYEIFVDSINPLHSRSAPKTAL